MTKTTKSSMMSDPYILEVLRELENMGHQPESAKRVLLRFYRPVKRVWGFEPNARDFALEIESVNKAVQRQFNPDDPNQIFIGDLRSRLKEGRKQQKRLR